MLRELHSGLEVIDLPSREVAGCDNRMEVTRLREDVDFVPQFDVASELADYMPWRETNRVTE